MLVAGPLSVVRDCQLHRFSKALCDPSLSFSFAPACVYRSLGFIKIIRKEGTYGHMDRDLELRRMGDPI